MRFTEVRQAPAWVLAAVVLVDIALVIAVVIGFSLGLDEPVARLTWNLVDGTMQANLLLMIVVVCGLIFWAGKLRPSDVGLMARRIPAALLFTLLLWLGTQMVVVLVLAAQGQPLRLHPALEEPNVLAGRALSQFLGNALYEEVIFRGFLLPQFFILAGGLRNSWARLGLALAASQAIFALIHVPIRIYQGTALGDLPGQLLFLFLLGVLYAAIYLATNNLLIAVGFHALGNLPSVPFEGAGAFLYPSVALVILGVYGLVTWLRKRSRRTGLPAWTQQAENPGPAAAE